MRQCADTWFYGDDKMRKWLILIVILVVLLLGIGVWLAGKAESGKPEPGEVRLEIENVL